MFQIVGHIIGTDVSNFTDKMLVINVQTSDVSVGHVKVNDINTLFAFSTDGVLNI